MYTIALHQFEHRKLDEEEEQEENSEPGDGTSVDEDNAFDWLSRSSGWGKNGAPAEEWSASLHRKVAVEAGSSAGGGASGADGGETKADEPPGGGWGGERRGQVVFDDSVTWTLVRVVSGGEEREGKEGENEIHFRANPCCEMACCRVVVMSCCGGV